MKLKYYLRGLGIGIIITTLILMIAYSGQKTELTDAEIIDRAKSLGMVMKEDPLFSNSGLDKENGLVTDSEAMIETETSAEQEPVSETESETETETETETEKEKIPETETETEIPVVPETEAVPSGETYHLVIPSGSVPRLICNELEEQGVIESASSLRQYLVDVGYATSIKVGEYDIPYGATNEEVYRILKAGPL